MRRFDLRAFSLIELLVVISIIAALASLILVGSGHALQDDKVMRTRAELAVLCVALEEFRRVYGDYPHVDPDATEEGYSAGESLFAALDGWRDSSASSGYFPTKRKSFIDRTAHKLQSATFNGDSGLCLLDPWENAYRYVYQPGGGWARSGYLLVSKGADGQMSLPLPINGLIGDAFLAVSVYGRTVNADNIMPADHE